jgi:hypothetical protein
MRRRVGAVNFLFIDASNQLGQFEKLWDRGAVWHHVGSDEVGIVASALLNDGRFAVLADRSTSGSPAQWGEVAVKCHDDVEVDDIVVEVNFGGDMTTEVIKQAAERVHQRGERDHLVDQFNASPQFLKDFCSWCRPLAAARA